jgi:hypothetical protein
MTYPSPGEEVSSPALILSSGIYQETGKIIRLITPQFGKISGFAPGAVRSQRRFAGSLEPMSFVNVHFRVPRDFTNSQSMVRLTQSELRDPFLHLRAKSEFLETGLFAVKLVDLVLPELHPDNAIFKALGRLLRDLKIIPSSPNTQWARILFWNWMGHHLGFGDIASQVDLFPNLDPELETLFRLSVESFDPTFLPFLQNIEKYPKLPRDFETQFYLTWTQVTGIHWNGFEKWNSVFA